MEKKTRIIISRTDNIGDVVLTLPVAGILKQHIEGCEIYFIGKSYTAPVIQSCINIHSFLDREELIGNPQKLKEIRADVIIHVYPDKDIAKIAYEAKIPMRIGTSHRLFHWLYCNKLPNFTRKNSDLHESQLNLKLLAPLGIHSGFELKDPERFYGLKRIPPLSDPLAGLIDTKKKNIILHPKSKGSAREWPINNYYKLAQSLSDCNLFITGTANEGKLIREENADLFHLPYVHDVTGKCSLEELISLIHKVEGMVACSTGPLHIAAAMGKNVCGLYPPMRPMHPGRWAPIGRNATTLVLKKNCSACKKSTRCLCIEYISPEQVASIVKSWKRIQTDE